MENLKKEYDNFGFFKIEDVVDKILIKKIVSEIISVKKNVDIYYDKKGSLRRIERLYDKGDSLKAVNKKILNLLKEIFNLNLHEDWQTRISNQIQTDKVSSASKTGRNSFTSL